MHSLTCQVEAGVLEKGNHQTVLDNGHPRPDLAPLMYTYVYMYTITIEFTCDYFSMHRIYLIWDLMKV